MKWLLSQLNRDPNEQFLLRFLEDLSRLRKISCSELDFHKFSRGWLLGLKEMRLLELEFRVFDGTDIHHGTYLLLLHLNINFFPSGLKVRTRQESKISTRVLARLCRSTDGDGDWSFLPTRPSQTVLSSFI